MRRARKKRAFPVIMNLIDGALMDSIPMMNFTKEGKAQIRASAAVLRAAGMLGEIRVEKSGAFSIDPRGKETAGASLGRLARAILRYRKIAERGSK